MTDTDSPFPHPVIELACQIGSYRRESFQDGAVNWDLEEGALLQALEEWGSRPIVAGGGSANIEGWGGIGDDGP